jgi:hypothetical protein
MNERWGALSERDHANASSLVAEILMYDRLIVPYPNNEEEIERWRLNNWMPDELFKLLHSLGSPAIGNREYPSYRFLSIGMSFSK